ncbi:hypothetical protein GCM10022381_29640 [Leifsonia kafniensis]|uniref:DUF222 domain-containing protein n=1 Tax=Leifsonia kafniensis TaxID=475957 RepID=A0ABP7KTI9_9MICO
MTHPVAIEEIVVQAEADMEQLLCARHLAENVQVGSAHSEEGGGNESGAQVFAAIGGLQGIDQLAHGRPEVRASCANVLPSLGRYTWRGSRKGFDRGFELRDPAIVGSLVARIRRPHWRRLCQARHR